MTFSKEDINKIKNKAPFPVAKIFESIRLENDPRNRAKSIIDLFEFTFQLLFVYGLGLATSYDVDSEMLDSILFDLERPSMGIWKNSLLNINNILRKEQGVFLFHHSKKIHNSPMHESFELLSKFLNRKVPNKPKLFHYLNLLIEFRNDRFAHGTISNSQAKLVVGCLENALIYWIQELKLFFECDLVYIHRVEWRDPKYFCTGMFLNGGIFVEPYNKTIESPIKHDRVFFIYKDQYINLYPFVEFNEDSKVFYIYNKTNNSEINLRSPFDFVKEKDIVIEATVVSNQKERNSTENLSLYHKIKKRIKNELSEEWLTRSQEKVWNQYLKIMEPPYYVINIYGVKGSGKTFLGWLIEKKGIGKFIDESEIDWSNYIGTERIILDYYNVSRRSLRSLRGKLHNYKIQQAIVLSRERARDDIPCLELNVTSDDINIVKANLYRELGIVIPDNDFKSLEDCYENLEDVHVQRK